MAGYAGGHWLQRWPGLALALAAILAVMVDNRVLVVDSHREYRSIRLPSWALPIWLNGPAFAFASLLLALTAGLLWYEKARAFALWWWAADTAFYALWTPLVLALNWYFLAAVDAMWFWLLAVGALFVYWRSSRMAAALMVPVLAWMSYIVPVSFAFWLLNH